MSKSNKNNRNNQRTKKKENNTGLYIGFAVVILASLGIIVLASMSGNKTNDNINDTSNVSLQDNEIIQVDSQNNKQDNEKETKNKVKSYELKDQFFVTMLDDIFINLNTYKGSRVTYEGFVYTQPDFNNEFFVTARTYFCCGTDSYIVGLECVYDESLKDKSFPSDNAWIKVSGIINSEIDVNGNEYPRLVIDSIEELTVRGNDVVNN